MQNILVAKSYKTLIAIPNNRYFDLSSTGVANNINNE